MHILQQKRQNRVKQRSAQRLALAHFIRTHITACVGPARYCKPALAGGTGARAPAVCKVFLLYIVSQLRQPPMLPKTVPGCRSMRRQEGWRRPYCMMLARVTTRQLKTRATRAEMELWKVKVQIQPQVGNIPKYFPPRPPPLALRRLRVALTVRRSGRMRTPCEASAAARQMRR